MGKKSGLLAVFSLNQWVQMNYRTDENMTNIWFFCNRLAASFSLSNESVSYPCCMQSIKTLLFAPGDSVVMLTLLILYFSIFYLTCCSTAANLN